MNTNTRGAGRFLNIHSCVAISWCDWPVRTWKTKKRESTCVGHGLKYVALELWVLETIMLEFPTLNSTRYKTHRNRITVSVITRWGLRYDVVCPKGKAGVESQIPTFFRVRRVCLTFKSITVAPFYIDRQRLDGF